MELKLVEEAIYNDEELLEILPMLKKANWDKALPLKRQEFFQKLHEVIASTDESLPPILGSAELIEAMDKSIYVGPNAILLDKSYFNKKLNPYKILQAYFFELILDSYIEATESSDEKDKSVDQRFRVNYLASPFGDWCNYYDRDSDKFFFQPLTNEAFKLANKITYNLIKYMHEKYGMDDYIGSAVSDIMLSEFGQKRKDSEVEQNYQEMLKNYKKYLIETKTVQNIMDVLQEYEDFSLLSDDDFYFVFNDKLIGQFDVSARLVLYSEFINRALKGYKNMEELYNCIYITKAEDGREVLVIDGKAYYVSVENELNLILKKVFSVKIGNLLLDELEDEDFKLEACECYEYLSELKDENNMVDSKYLGNAYAYIECLSYLSEYYRNIIARSIKNNKLFNEGEPIVNRGNFSKYDAYLSFTFDKEYEEVRRLQFATLKEQYEAKKKGAKR